LSAPFVVAAAEAGHVAIATGDTGGQPPSQVTFVVLDAQTGAEVSRFDAGHPERFDLSEVALRDGHLDYAQRASIVSRRTSNGEQAWRRTVDDQAGAVTMARSPDDRTVFALRSGSVGSVAALDAISGRKRWTHTGYLAAAGDRTAVLGRPHPSRTLRGIDASSGARRWQREIPADLAPIGTLGLRVRAAGDLLVLSNDCNVG